MVAATALAEASVLTDDMIARCGERAAGYDRDNRFFDEDFDELREAGYLRMPIPKEFGGLGLTLAEVAREQHRLAYRPSDSPGDQHASVLDGRRSGSLAAG